MRFRASLIAALCWLILPAPVPACSLGPSYLQRSNFELVRDTGAIALARSLRLEKRQDGHSQIVFEVVKTIKGSVAEKTLSVTGNTNWRGASDPADFSTCRPGAGTGGCIAYDYRLGRLFLLFLEKHEEGWEVWMSPFSRVNEEVEGEDAPWTRAVIQYLRIAELGTAGGQKEALRALMVREHGVPGLSADVERHFRSPHGSKSFEDLEAIYERAENDDTRRRILWAYANGQHSKAATFIRDLIGSGDLSTFIEPVSGYVETLHDARAAASLLDRFSDLALDGQSRWAVFRAIAEASDDSVRGDMVALLKTVSDEETRPLTKYFLRHPDPAAIAELVRRQAGDRVEKSDLTLSLAALGDPGTVTWALSAQKDAGDQRWISCYVLAISPLEEADQAAVGILRGTDAPAQKWLVEGYGYSRSGKRIERLIQAFKKYPENEAFRRSVHHALEQLAWQDDREAQEALKGLPRPASK